MTISTEQQAALEKPVVREIYFAEFQYKSGTVRCCSLNVSVPWNGYTWLGVGSLAGIGAVEEAEGSTTKGMSFTLNAAQLEWLSLAIGDVDEYRGRKAKLWMCPLDEGFQLIGEPEICWRGVIDAVAVEIDGDNGTITQKCETAAYGMRGSMPMRISAAQHKMKHPTDTGLDHLQNLIANPTVWTSKRFQQQ